MIVTKSEHISSYQDKQPREQRHPADMAKNWSIYTKECKYCIEQVAQCGYHWYKLQHNK